MCIQHPDAITRFIVITVPPRTICRKLEQLITECSILGDTYEAASYPPHITLRTGALVPNSDVVSFVEGFGKSFESLRQVRLSTAGIKFDAYVNDGKTKFFIGYRIEKTIPLFDLHVELMTYDAFIKNRQSEFDPHLSLAYHDLEEESFVKLKEHILANPDTYGRDFSWNMDNVSLYVKDGGTWKPHYVHRLE